MFCFICLLGIAGSHSGFTRVTACSALINAGFAGYGKEGVELSGDDFPTANTPIVTAVQLPEYYLVTPNPGDDFPTFLAQLETRLRDGIRLVQLRAKTLSDTDYLALAKQCQGLCERHDAALMLNADPGLVAEVGAAGVHFDSGRLASLSERPDVKWVSASCHPSEQLRQAEKLGTVSGVGGSGALSCLCAGRDDAH